MQPSPARTMLAKISKDHIVKAVTGLPEEATVDDAIERLLLLGKIEQGLEQSRRARRSRTTEVKHRMEEWIAS